jgi:predicted DCC family thiol-disulfide oxidoreductase YuxK
LVFPTDAATTSPLVDLADAGSVVAMANAMVQPATNVTLADILPAELGGRQLIVFDGVCVLCSGFARMVTSLDKADRFRFATAQSPLGERLFRHFGLPTDVYETNLVIINGVGYQRLESVIATMRELGWPWRAVAVLSLLPASLRDWIYKRIATNRYAWFGKRDGCDIPSPALRGRLIG